MESEWGEGREREGKGMKWVCLYTCVNVNVNVCECVKKGLGFFGEGE